MIIIPEDLPSPPNQVFVLATPAHMLAKLNWEIYTLKKALTEQPEHLGHIHAPAYCAFNCAVTAWQLTDWVWESSSQEKRKEILTRLEADRTVKPNKAFHNALKEVNRALYLCWQIATGSKHMIINSYPDPNVKAEMRWKIEPARVGEMRCGDPLAVHFYQLTITDNGNERSAVEVFDDAFNIWKMLLGEWGFIEGNIVSASPYNILSPFLSETELSKS